ncbi:hypothetical protein HELRODRAFT_75467, partial [Helobdella robusta]|uniref:SH3 domain-containing protein n=1 Tax=Helobdella robusta TaxID=6412 RepID=T1G254_HELRO
MSPNPDAVREELAFKEGQIIKVIGSKDGDGFYRGELSDGSRGLVPSNMISEIDDPSSASQRRSACDRTQAQWNTLPSQRSVNKFSSGQFGFGGSGGARQMVAIQNFDPMIHAPNRDVEPGLPLRIGDVVTVHGKVDINGYYRAERNGSFGIVPAYCLQDIAIMPNSIINSSPGMLSSD